MTQILTWGDIPLRGEVAVQGSKNAALPLMAAAVLHRGRTVLHNCPHILDVDCMSDLLREVGCTVAREGHTLVIDAREVRSAHVRAESATRLRASVLLLGSLLGRLGEAELPYPGGCLIGRRPIDLHLALFEKMGAKTECTPFGLHLCTKQGHGGGLHGSRETLSYPSVGATENAILGAVLAEGSTELRGCAREPEIEELCLFLREKGARIEGIGSGTLTIQGVKELKDSEYTLMPDRIVAGTYLLAAAGTRGHIRLLRADASHLQALLAVLREMGADVLEDLDGIEIDAGQAARAVHLRTSPYPGFPTDLQSQVTAALCRGEGVSTVCETVFESRFLIAGELQKMGADIHLDGRCACITGKKYLSGARVRARELRGGAALVAAGLMARGKTVIEGSSFIRRGYEDICGDLEKLGARIKEV